MTIYIALLRGINVGGKNRIKMDELRKLMNSIGLNQVQTYIQSGNILFQSEKGEETLCQLIESEIERVFGFLVNVIIRTSVELDKIIESCPFSEEEIVEAESTSERERLYVALLQEIPNQERMNQLSTFKREDERFLNEGKEIYLLFNKSIRNSKLANNLQKLDVPCTVRNWKTINRLSIMAKGIENDTI